MSDQKLDFTRTSVGDLSLKVGLTFSQQLVWNAETSPESDVFNPVDLTGYTAKMQVRKQVGQPVVLELSTANGRIVLGGPAATITLTVAPADTAALANAQGLYQYDLELTSNAGFVSRLVYGLFEIVGIITV